MIINSPIGLPKPIQSNENKVSDNKNKAGIENKAVDKNTTNAENKKLAIKVTAHENLRARISEGMDVKRAQEVLLYSKDSIINNPTQAIEAQVGKFNQNTASRLL